MNPDIFIDDFERTENTDELHAMLGRALIVATRFDSMCKTASLQLQIKDTLSTKDNNDPTLLIEQLVKKYEKKSLDSSIKTLGLPGNLSVLLSDAKESRNAVAHDLAKGLTGSLDIRLNDQIFIAEVADLVFDIAHGDIVISRILSTLNDESLPNQESISAYVDQVVKWVIER